MVKKFTLLLSERHIALGVLRGGRDRDGEILTVCDEGRRFNVKVVYYHQAKGDSFVFDLIFDRSVEKYLWDLLSESAPDADDLAHAFGNAT